MADFFVAPSQRAYRHTFVVAPRNHLIFELLNSILFASRTPERQRPLKYPVHRTSCTQNHRVVKCHCITTILVTTKKGLKYKLFIQKGDDVLCAVDKFLKKSKLEIRFVKDVSVLREHGESMLERTARIIAQSLKFKIKDF